MILGTSSGYAGDLILSDVDSASFAGDTILPVISSETVTENGREVQLITRELTTVDGLLRITCVFKNEAGLIVNTSCSIHIDTIADIDPPNQFIKGVSGIEVAKIAEQKDLHNLKNAFQRSGICSGSIKTVLYSSREKQEVTLPNGTVLAWPSLKITCGGTSSSESEGFTLAILPRSSL